MIRTALLLGLIFALGAQAAEPPVIRLGRGFAAEEQVWLMSVRKDLTPNQDKRYRLNQILFQANPERFQAFLAGELDGGTAPGLAVIAAREKGADMTIVARRTPFQVNTISMPSAARTRPRGPRRESAWRRSRPIAVGGRTSGSESRVSRAPLPGPR